MKNTLRNLVLGSSLALASISTMPGCESGRMILSDGPYQIVDHTYRPKIDGSYRSYKRFYDSIRIDAADRPVLTVEEGGLYSSGLEADRSSIRKEIFELKRQKGLNFLNEDEPTNKDIAFLELYNLNISKRIK